MRRVALRELLLPFPAGERDSGKAGRFECDIADDVPVLVNLYPPATAFALCRR
jgi:hypothetical protein